MYRCSFGPKRSGDATSSKRAYWRRLPCFSCSAFIAGVNISLEKLYAIRVRRLEQEWYSVDSVFRFRALIQRLAALAVTINRFSGPRLSDITTSVNHRLFFAPLLFASLLLTAQESGQT